MFKFLKEKVKGAIDKISTKAEEEAETIETPVEEKKEAPKKEETPKPEKKESILEKIKDKVEKTIHKKEEPEEKLPEEPKEETPEPEKKEGILEKIKDKVEETIHKKEEPKEKLPEEPKDIPEPPKEELVVEEPEEKKGFFAKVKEKISKEEKKEEPEEIKLPKVEDVPKEEPKPEEPKKKGIFGKVKEKISSKKISEKQFADLFWDLELALLENNVAVEVIEKIKKDLKINLVDVPIPRGEINNKILTSLKTSITEVLKAPEKQILDLIKQKQEKPYVIVFLGTNGAGKTTTIAKVTNLLQKNNLKCVLAAGDTWRSAAIQQLEAHAKKLNVPIIKHDYGSDPAAVAFDAVKMAKGKNLDVVLVDTAGRQHSNINLMDELKKIVRVSKPDLKLYVGEMISGNDCIDQINSFDKAINVDGVILTKADIDDKGGTAISVTYVTKKPIFYLGKGQEYEQLEEFTPKNILDNLGF